MADNWLLSEIVESRRLHSVEQARLLAVKAAQADDERLAFVAAQLSTTFALLAIFEKLPP